MLGESYREQDGTIILSNLKENFDYAYCYVTIIYDKFPKQINTIFIYFVNGLMPPLNWTLCIFD